MITESYCFLNECTIILQESNVTLNVINSTGSWIIAANTTNLFKAFTNNSICSTNAEVSPQESDDVILQYVLPGILYFVLLAAAVANIIMHLIYKELQTVSGILIIILCISISIIAIFGITYVVVTYSSTVGNSQEELCAVINYCSVVLCFNVYEAAKTTILSNFAYTMYRTYRLLGAQKNEKRSLLYKYIIFIIVTSAVSSIVVITVDVTGSQKAFDTEDGGCTLLFFITIIQLKEETQLE